MELEDEEAKDLVQRQRSQWKELARDPNRIEIVVKKMLSHFLEHPDPNGFKAQLVAVDRKACAQYKIALDAKLTARGLPPEWSDVIISGAQNSEPEVARFEYPKTTQDDLIDYFKLTPSEWEAWNRERHGEDRSKWRPLLKILIVCDRLLTGFDAAVNQVMYLDKPSLSRHTRGGSSGGSGPLRVWLTVQSLCPETERAKQWLSANGRKLAVGLDGICEKIGQSPACSE